MERPKKPRRKARGRVQEPADPRTRCRLRFPSTSIVRTLVFRTGIRPFTRVRHSCVPACDEARATIAESGGFSCDLLGDPRVIDNNDSNGLRSAIKYGTFYRFDLTVVGRTTPQIVYDDAEVLKSFFIRSERVSSRIRMSSALADNTARATTFF